MATPADPGRIDLLRIGPVKVIDIVLSATPADRPVSNDANIDSVPFSQVRHLCSAKPLGRFGDPRGERRF